MSEQQAEPTSGESGSVSAGQEVPNSSAAADQPAASQPVLKAAAEVESPDLVPGQADAPRPDASRAPGKIMIMSSGDRDWDRKAAEPEFESEPNSGMFGKRRLSALAAVVALAAAAGALGGALASAGVMHVAGGASTTSGNLGLEASVARLDAERLALKAGAEHSFRVGTSQYN